MRFALALLLFPAVLHAQHFVDTVKSPADTFIVYGYKNFQVTFDVTVDSVVKVQPPVVLGKAYGPSALYSLSTLAPYTGSGGESSNAPEYVLSTLAKARATKTKVILNLPCGAHNQDPNKRGFCLRDSSGIAVFSRAKFDSALAKFNTTEIRNALLTAYRDTVLIAVNLMDEPWVKGLGDGNTWGPKGLTRQQADTSCRSAHAILGPIPVGTSDASPKVWNASYLFKWCDVGIPQFSYRMGSPAVWRDTLSAQASAGGYQQIYSHNVVNGGTQDKDGTWDCSQQGGIKGTASPNCTMTPTQINTAVAALGDAGCGILLMWRADSTRFAKLGTTVFNAAASTQAQRLQRWCKVRS